MTTKAKTIVVAGVVATAVVCFALGRHYREAPPQVSLTFQRYSDMDPYVDDVAFLNLTNASNRGCTLFMTGNSNTLVMDTAFGHFSQSLMVNCEFSDQTPQGWTNWAQLPSPSLRSNAYASLPARSGLVVRVPLPPGGQNRKVAVLYRPDPPAWQFWLISPRGQPFFRFLLRVLPRSGSASLFKQQPLLRAWCGQALTNRWEQIAEH